MPSTTLYPSKSVYVRNGTSAALNFNAEANLRFGVGSSVASIYRSLLKFDIPGNWHINTAVLSVYSYSNSCYQAAVDIRFQAVLSSWEQNTVTWDTQPANLSPDGAVQANKSGYAVWYDFDFTTLCQLWADGDITNYGALMFQPDETIIQRSKCFYRSDATYKPKLQMIYTERTIPGVPTNLRITPNAFDDTVTLQWDAASAGVYNDVVDYIVGVYKNDVYQGEAQFTDGATSLVVDTSGWANGDKLHFGVQAYGEHEPYTGDAAWSSAYYKNRIPNTPTSAFTSSTTNTTPKTSFVPGDTIRVRFTPPSPRDPDTGLTGDIAGYEVKMQDQSDFDYNSGQIMGTNASASATYVDVDSTGWSPGGQWKFLVRGYDSYGARGNWSYATALVSMNTAPAFPYINYPVTGSTVFNSRPRLLLTAAASNDGPKHTLCVKVESGSYVTTALDGTKFSCGTDDTLDSSQKVVFKHDADLSAGAHSVYSKMYDSILYSNEVSRMFYTSGLVFTDSDLTTTGMLIKAVHLTELRVKINNLREAYGLTAYTWTTLYAYNPAFPNNKTFISDATIITEMQTALQAVIDVINNWDSSNTTLDIPAVSWINPVVTVGGLTGVGRTALRQAIEQIRTLLPTI